MRLYPDLLSVTFALDTILYVSPVSTLTSYGSVQLKQSNITSQAQFGDAEKYAAAFISAVVMATTCSLLYFRPHCCYMWIEKAIAFTLVFNVFTMHP